MKVSKTLSLIAIAGALCSLSAHDFWVGAKSENDKIKAYIGYGHDFARPEKIDEKRLTLFEPLQIVSKSGNTTLMQKGENFEFEGTKTGKEAVIVVGKYKPTFWSKDQNGKWSMNTDKQSGKDVAFCGSYEMMAKGFVGGSDDEIFKTPVGLALEILPIGDINKISANQPFKFQVLIDGKPLKDAEFKGMYDGIEYGKFAFAIKSDENGMVEIRPEKSGFWMLKVKYTRAYKDPKICDENELITTLTFDVE